MYINDAGQRHRCHAGRVCTTLSRSFANFYCISQWFFSTYCDIFGHSFCECLLIQIVMSILHAVTPLWISTTSKKNRVSRIQCLLTIVRIVLGTILYFWRPQALSSFGRAFAFCRWSSRRCRLKTADSRWTLPYLHLPILRICFCSLLPARFSQVWHVTINCLVMNQIILIFIPA